jgi:glutaredoxin-related protein
MPWNKLTKEEETILRRCNKNNCPDCDDCVPILESIGAYWDYCDMMEEKGRKQK